MRLEILLEEPSMVNVLKELLPKIIPEKYKINENYFLRPHQGKNDLQKSIVKKIKVFSNFYEPTKIVILHDQDSNDCIELKNKLKNLCKIENACPVLIRIVCRELESWYIGDFDAIAKAYPTFKSKKYSNKSKSR